MQRRDWLEAHRQDLLQRRVIVHSEQGHPGGMALVPPERYVRVLQRVLDTAEFLSPYGIRSLSAAYRDSTTVQVGEHQLSLRYSPGESDSGLFGGNSNWRGPVWLPVNALLVDAMRTYAHGGRRPSQPHDHPDDPLWDVHPTFSEYFHGDTGEGLGASHQTGWTSLVAHVMCTPRAL